MIVAPLLALQIVSPEPVWQSDSHRIMSSACSVWNEHRQENGSSRSSDVLWAQALIDGLPWANMPAMKFVERVDVDCSRSPETTVGEVIVAAFPHLMPERD